uniref:tubulin polyglutamylase ttll6-like isoform X3 n=1 Tax=Ciona intestinalis TaxID=7719 RepID=UPI000EF4D16A|nr:tubulin polyglutamylase ttll6-like isoform X3 [Ciona intestinalis]|eukprot:XP_026689436.1 tubulin polyglutamylase ttll6-like isoform X3 [Ciona intestinalis]
MTTEALSTQVSQLELGGFEKEGSEIQKLISQETINSEIYDGSISDPFELPKHDQLCTVNSFASVDDTEIIHFNQELKSQDVSASVKSLSPEISILSPTHDAKETNQQDQSPITADCIQPATAFVVMPVEKKDETPGEEFPGEITPRILKKTDEVSITCSSPSRKKKKKKKKWIGICTSNCKYDSVRRMSRKFGMKEISEDDEWTIFWTDYSVSLERVMEMKRFQKINHFPGMNEICRKDFLARNMNRLHKLFPKEYSCFPKTWCLPADYSDFQAYCRTKKNKTFICKPESGCQGKGIFLTKNPKDIKPGEHMICQQYVNKCLTIDGFKFDFRLYVLVTSCDPLRIFMFKEGLGRFATKKYQEPNNHNLDEVCMHLTNYAINKNSEDFVRDDESGSKRKLATVCQWLDDHGYDVPKMWASIEDVVIKTLISAHPILKHNYRTCFPNHLRGSACFEILGFDVMLDKKLKAWLLEVNHSPSFHTDAKLDKEVKEGLLYDTLNLLDLRSIDRKKCLEEDRRRVKERLMAKPKSRESRLEEIKTTQTQYLESLEKYENEHLGGFRRIYPIAGHEKYNGYFENSCSLFQTTAAAKAREEAAKAQREEIRVKQEKREAMLRGRPYRPDLKKEAGESGGGEKKHHSGIVPFRHRPMTRQLAVSFTLTRQFSPEVEVIIDTSKPVDISEDEELERISGLLQRDSLIRSLGIVEQVHRLLHCTPGTTGITKNILPQAQHYQVGMPLGVCNISSMAIPSHGQKGNVYERRSSLMYGSTLRSGSHHSKTWYMKGMKEKTVKSQIRKSVTASRQNQRPQTNHRLGEKSRNLQFQWKNSNEKHQTHIGDAFSFPTDLGMAWHGGLNSEQRAALDTRALAHLPTHSLSAPNSYMKLKNDSSSVQYRFGRRGQESSSATLPDKYLSLAPSAKNEVRGRLSDQLLLNCGKGKKPGELAKRF